MKIKKQRGARRRMNTLLHNIETFEPFQQTNGRYEHFLVPSSGFINNPRTRGKLKTEFIVAWLAKTTSFIRMKPKELSFCRIVALIKVPNYWKSQIIIFYDKEYYGNFWNRHSREQTWVPMNEHHSLIKSRNVKTDLKEKCYLELLADDCNEKIIHKSLLWFYEEL